MRKYLLFLYSLVFLLLGSGKKEATFQLSERQKQMGWYLEYEKDDIARLMHPVLGCLKYVKLTAPAVKPGDNNLQVIDLSNVDTSLYNPMFEKVTFFPASGIAGYPIQIGDFNHNNKLDFYGAYNPDWWDYQLAKACVVELSQDSNFVLRKIYGDTIIEPLPHSDFNHDGLLEMNFRKGRHLANLRSLTPGIFPDSINFTYRLWKGGGGEVGAETFFDLDQDSEMDILYVGDDTLPPAGAKKIFIAEYNPNIDRLEQKYRFYPPDFTTYGFSVGDFDADGKIEFVTGSIHGHVYIFENTGNDAYSFIKDDTISTSNAYLTVATNDLDNNGKIEFLIGGSSYFNGIGGTRFYWYEANGNNNYSKIRSFMLLGVDPLSWDEIHTFDVNNDGKDEILINYTYSIVILKWNNSAGQFEIYWFSYYNKPVHGTTMYDLNSDGRLDFFISTKEIYNNPARRTYYFKNRIISSLYLPNEGLPFTFILEQNYPNPFNNSTSIEFDIPIRTEINLTIFNILGKEVKVLLKKKTYIPGQHEISWDATDDNGKEVSSGLYICVLSDGKQFVSRKMLLIK